MPEFLKHTGATRSLGFLFYKQGNTLCDFRDYTHSFVISLPSSAPALLLCSDAEPTAHIIKHSVRSGSSLVCFLLSFVWPSDEVGSTAFMDFIIVGMTERQPTEDFYACCCSIAVVSNSSESHGLQCTRLPLVHCLLILFKSLISIESWCDLTISSSVSHSSSCPQSRLDSYRLFKDLDILWSLLIILKVIQWGRQCL